MAFPHTVHKDPDIFEHTEEDVAGEAAAFVGHLDGDRFAPPCAFERALVAYERAAQLAPDKPHLINDTAVILHYYLKRDFLRARDMYAAAYELAAERLSDPKLETGDRDLATTALRDSKDNLRRLEEYLERRRRVESPLPIR